MRSKLKTARSRLETLGGLFVACCTLEPWLLLIIGCVVAEACLRIIRWREVSV